MTRYTHSGDATNAVRAKRAYTRVMMPVVSDPEIGYLTPQEILIDLLTDLRHLQERWKSMGLDLNAAIQTSQWHFDEAMR